MGVNPGTFFSLGTMSEEGSGPCGGSLETRQKPVGALENLHAWKGSFPGRCAKPQGGQGQVCWLPAISKASMRNQGVQAPPPNLPPLCSGPRDSHTTAEGLAVGWGADLSWAFLISAFPWNRVTEDHTL